VRSRDTSDKTITLVLTVTLQYQNWQNQNVKPSWIMLQQDSAADGDDDRNSESDCKANSQPLTYGTNTQLFLSTIITKSKHWRRKCSCT